MKFVAYYRVSTQKQGQSGLGLDAQQDAVQRLVAFRNGSIVKAFQEIESGANNDRPQLASAMAEAKRHNATLIVAKLDRLARDAKFLLHLADSGTPILFGDFPDLDATTPVGRMVLTQMAAVAEFERRRISERITAALAQIKAKGGKMGGGRTATSGWSDDARSKAFKALGSVADQKALEYAKLIAEIDPDNQLSRRALAKELNTRGIPTHRNGKWTTSSVTRLLQRIEAIHEQQRAIAAKSVRSISDRLQVKPRKVRPGSSRCGTRSLAG